MALKFLSAFRAVQPTKWSVFTSVLNFSKIPFPIIRPFLHLYFPTSKPIQELSVRVRTAFYPQFPLFSEILLNTTHISLFINYLSKHSYATKANTFPPRMVNMVQSVWLFFTEAFWLFSFLNWLPNVGEQICPYCATVNRHINVCF